MIAKSQIISKLYFNFEMTPKSLDNLKILFYLLS